MHFYLNVGFSSPAQASFFLICEGDSADPAYRSGIMPRFAHRNKIWTNVVKKVKKLILSIAWWFFHNGAYILKQEVAVIHYLTIISGVKDSVSQCAENPMLFKT